MTDLQCPATFLLLPREILASGACERAFVGRRLSRIFIDAAVAADPRELAAISGQAHANDCPVEIVKGLIDVASFRQALEELADLYRGETVAVVTTAEMIQIGLSSASMPTEPIIVAINSTGWTVTRS